MDQLMDLGMGYDLNNQMMFAPEPYGIWQVQNYINARLSDNEKASMIAQILTTVKSEDARRKIEAEFDRFKTNRNSPMQ